MAPGDPTTTTTSNAPPTKIIRPLASMHPPSTARAWLSAPHPSAPLLATACADRSVRLYSLRTFQLLECVGGGHKRSVRSVAWKPDAPAFVRRDEADKAGNVNAEGSEGEASGIGRSRKGKKRRDWVFASGSFDATAGIWRRKERDEDEDESEKLRGNDVDGDEDDEADEDEDEEWRYAVALEGHDSEIKSVAWSPTGQFLATCARDKSVWIWEDVVDSFALGGGGGGAATFSNSNNDSYDGYEATSSDNYETVAVLSEHEGDVKCVAWHPSPDVNLLASASYDDTVRLYRDDVDDDWSCVAVLEGHADTVWFVDFEGLGVSRPRDKPGEGNGSKGEEQRLPGNSNDSGAAEDITSSQPESMDVDTNPKPSTESQQPTSQPRPRTERARSGYLARRKAAGPRLASSSADGTVRIWSKIPPSPPPPSTFSPSPPSSTQQQHQQDQEQDPQTSLNSALRTRMPSIIRPLAAPSGDEEWAEEATLPPRHDGAVYAVSWSGRTGRIVSAGGDGRVVVYEERWRGVDEGGPGEGGDVEVEAEANTEVEAEDNSLAEWAVVAELEAAHGVYEINHVCWAQRWDRGRTGPGSGHGVVGDGVGERDGGEQDEEVLVTTGDDGEVRVWMLG